MEYILWIKTPSGWKQNGIVDLDNLLFILDTIAEEDFTQSVIVEQYNHNTDKTDVFYMTPNTIEQYYEWREVIERAKNRDNVFQIIK